MTTKEEALPVPQFGMIEPNGRDVLFGRGKNMFNHNGNVRFRLLIQQRSKEYENAPSRRIKSAIVYAIVQTVHGYGGRFLKREKGPVWEVVTASEAIQKVGHALRDKKQHDLKMQAKQLAHPSDSPPPVVAKNKSVEGGCNLLLQLGEVCAKEMGVSHHDLNGENSCPPMSSKRTNPAALPVSAPKRKIEEEKNKSFSNKRRKSYTDETYRKEKVGTAEANYCARLILGLGEHSAGGVKPNVSQKPESGAAATIRPLTTYELSQPIRHQPWEGTRPKLVDPGKIPLYMLAQNQTKPEAHMGAPSYRPQMIPPSRKPYQPSPYQLERATEKPAPTHLKKSCYPPKPTRDLPSLQHTSRVAGLPARGLNFPPAPGISLPADQNSTNPLSRQVSTGVNRDEPSRQVTPPPIPMDDGGEDGGWIFYPIKVPNINITGAGWKLALMPIDGNGQPVELDPDNIQFPVV